MHPQLGLYASLALPLAFGGLPIYIQAPDLYATEFLVPLAQLGFLLLLVRLVDAVQDPIIGSLSDRYAARRPGLILLGLGLMALGFCGLFSPWLSNVQLSFVLSLLVCTTGYSLASINYHTMGSLWQQPGDTSQVTGWREAMGLFGLLCASVIPALLVQKFGKLAGLKLLPLVFLPLLLLGCFLFLRWYKSAVFIAPSVLSQQVFAQQGFYVLWQQTWTRHFMGWNFASAFASAIPGVLVLFFIRDQLNAEAYTGLFLLLYFLSGVAAMPLWNLLARRWGKTQSWCCSMLMAVGAFVWAFFLVTGDTLAYGIICVAAGAALGADLALPPALLADFIQRNQQAHNASRYFSLLIFTNKLALALATGLTLPLLAWAGFKPGESSAAGHIALAVVYALVPCVLKILAAIGITRRASLLNAGELR